MKISFGYRLHYVKRIAIRKKRDVTLLKNRLDVYSDEWRTAQPDPITDTKCSNFTPTGKLRKPRTKKSDSSQPNSSPAKEIEVGIPAQNGNKSLTKRKRSKSDKVRRLKKTMQSMRILT